jgi:hypothetical protein
MNIRWKRERGVVDWCRCHFMKSMIGNVFIEYDIAQGKEMICGKGANAVSSATWGVPHEEALHRLVAEFSLKFNRDVRKTADSPGSQMRHIGLASFKYFVWSDVVRYISKLGVS